jgi:hypothetical protein
MKTCPRQRILMQQLSNSWKWCFLCLLRLLGARCQRNVIFYYVPFSIILTVIGRSHVSPSRTSRPPLVGRVPQHEIHCSAHLETRTRCGFNVCIFNLTLFSRNCWQTGQSQQPCTAGFVPGVTACSLLAYIYIPSVYYICPFSQNAQCIWPSLLN